VDHPGVVDMRNIPESFHARMTAVMQLQQEWLWVTKVHLQLNFLPVQLSSRGVRERVGVDWSSCSCRFYKNIWLCECTARTPVKTLGRAGVHHFGKDGVN
jgi:hypothetical protein